MTTTEPIYAYTNGNCRVTIAADGTKSRTWEGEASPALPESIDLKITDFCDAGCPYCHEQSTRRGTHADVAAVLSAVDGLPQGAEIAIGGGNPLSHPELPEILSGMRRRDLVPNLTVNAVHLEEFGPVVRGLRRRGLIYGLGISYSRDHGCHVVEYEDENTVIHLIAGVHRPSDAFFMTRHQRPRKVLVLGYKQYGFGLKFYSPGVEHRISQWRYWIGTMMRNPDLCVSFDNLALEQLRVRDWLPAAEWSERFMGEDGTFTMYVDAVAKTFAATSTGRREPINGRSIREMFAVIAGGK